MPIYNTLQLLEVETTQVRNTTQTTTATRTPGVTQTTTQVNPSVAATVDDREPMSIEIAFEIELVNRRPFDADSPIDCP
jgi:hypothetical protein